MVTSRFEAEKFTGKNDFGLWRLKMKALLVQQGLAEALQADPKGEEAALDEKSKIKKEGIKEKAHSALILSLGDKVLREVAKETTASGIWSKLESLYMTKSLANRLFMKQRLYAYRFFEEKGISEQLEEFNKAVDDLENIDMVLEDEDKAIILLNALPKSFDQLRDAMLYGRESSISLEEVQSALKAKELQKSNSKSGSEPYAESLNIKKFKQKKGFKKKQVGPKFPANKAQDQNEKETRSCHWCKKPGHLKKNCWAWKKKQAEEGGNQNTTDCVEEVEIPEILNVMEKADKGSWIMDSGCSFHMCPVKEWFEDLIDEGGSVLLGNNQVCNIRGKGQIRFRMHDGSVKILSDVRYIPEVKRNLISLGMLELKGFSFLSSNRLMKVTKESQVVMVAERRSGLYYLIAEVITGCANVVQKTDLRKWHMRLGHLSASGIKELVKRGLISPADSGIEEIAQCEECILGKSKKQPYQKGIHSSTAPLD